MPRQQELLGPLKVQSPTCPRMVYKAVVLGVLLYGSETWTTKRDATKKMEAFHNRCLRQIVCITSAQQRTELISSVQVACQFGMEESLEDIVIARRPRWLGHLARMDDHRLPKKILFGWLPQRHPAHGTRMRWRDRVRKDLKKFNIDERRWYQLAQDRSSSRRNYRTGLEDVTEARVAEDERRRTRVEDSIKNSGSSTATDKPYQCIRSVCERAFRRKQDIDRHRCVTTRQKH